MNAVVRSILFAVIFYGGSVPLVSWAALATLGNERFMLRASRLWARYFMWCVRHILGIEIVLRGALPQHKGIVAVKHQSAFETIAMLALFERPAVVLKAELTRIPVWGFVARRQGVIPVEREASGKAMRTMMRAADAATQSNRPIIIFPEGTRAPYGTQPPLKPGIAGIYKLLKLPVTPIALDAGRLWPKSFVKQPGRITLAIQEEIPPGLPREEFERRLHAAINQDPAA